MRTPGGAVARAEGTAGAEILKVHLEFKDQQGGWRGWNFYLQSAQLSKPCTFDA